MANEEVILPDADDESANTQSGQDEVGDKTPDTTEPANPEEGEQGNEKETSDQKKVSEPGKEEPKEEGKPEQKKNRYQERINRITTQKYEAIARAEVAERQKAILQQRLESLLSAPAPKPADFETEESFEEARLAHIGGRTAARLAAETATEAARIAAQEADMKRVESFRERVREDAKVIPDYMEKVSKSQAPISRYMGDAIYESPHAAHILYHFAENPDDAQEIFAMPPVEQIKEIGRLEGRIQDRLKQVQSARTPTGLSVTPPVKAPPVIRPSGATSGGKVKGFDPYDTSLTDAEYVARYKKSRGLA